MMSVSIACVLPEFCSSCWCDGGKGIAYSSDCYSAYNSAESKKGKGVDDVAES